MNKAFTKELDGDEELPDDVLEDGTEAELPSGKNYVTPVGFQQLQTELLNLRRVERPKVVEIVSWAAGNGDRSENGDYIYGKKRLREIDRRLRYLTKRCDSAEIVDPTKQKNHAQVFFGATVTYADTKDAEHTVRIVGIDEANLDAGLISWVSPIARALLKASVGDTVKVRTPHGEESIEVVDIKYATA